MKPNILIAPDKFRATLTASEVCDICADIISTSFPEVGITKFPLADGGEGTAGFVAQCLGLGLRRVIPAHDSAMHPVEADCFYDPVTSTAVIDAASVLSTSILPASDRQTMIRTSYPLGQSINGIIRTIGPRTLYVGIGGTSTSDGGAGMLQALGARYFASCGNEITGYMTPRRLLDIHRADFSEIDLNGCCIKALCDVDVPLIAGSGEPSALTFARQKGCSTTDIPMLHDALGHWEEVTHGNGQAHFAGAGGGLGYAFGQLLRAEMASGSRWAIEHIPFNLCPSLVITGEGKIDNQTSMGKIVGEIAATARQYAIPVIAIGGTVESSFDAYELFHTVVSTTDFLPDEELTPTVATRRLTLAIESLLPLISRLTADYSDGKRL